MRIQKSLSSISIFNTSKCTSINHKKSHTSQSVSQLSVALLCVLSCSSKKAINIFITCCIYGNRMLAVYLFRLPRNTGPSSSLNWGMGGPISFWQLCQHTRKSWHKKKSCMPQKKNPKSKLLWNWKNFCQGRVQMNFSKSITFSVNGEWSKKWNLGSL